MLEIEGFHYKIKCRHPFLRPYWNGKGIEANCFIQHVFIFIHSGVNPPLKFSYDDCTKSCRFTFNFKKKQIRKKTGIRERNHVSVAGFMPPLAEGWLLVHWAYGSRQRQKHKFDVGWNIYFLDLGMALEDSQILALKKALQEWMYSWAMSRILKQWLKHKDIHLKIT